MICAYLLHRRLYRFLIITHFISIIEHLKMKVSKHDKWFIMVLGQHFDMIGSLVI